MTDNFDSDTNNAPAGFGSMENAVLGKYEISISAVLSEAWRRIEGKKGTIWLAMIFYIVIVVVFSIIVKFFLNRFGITDIEGDPFQFHRARFGLANLIQMVVTVPLSTGIAMLGIKMAADVPVDWDELFKYFEKMVVLIGTTLLMYLLILIGFCLFILPGLYLALAYTQAIPLVINKGLNPWDALETSRKALTHEWFSLFGLYLIFLLIVIVACIPLGLGLIWVVPMGVLMKGVVYRTIFGYERETDQAAIAG